MNKVCETGPPVYRPYPRRLETLIICRCHYKDSTFSSVIFKTLSVGLAKIRTRALPTELSGRWLWCNLVQIGATWCRLVQPCAVWCRLVQFGATWCRFVKLAADLCSFI